MKKIIIGAVLVLGSLVFGQDLDSREGDSLALVAIKKANPGSDIDWSSWNEINPISTWKGVGVKDDRIDTLSLVRYRLWRLPPEIGNLSKVTNLNCAWNYLETFPSEFKNLKNLTTLRFSMTLLLRIPLEITELTNLRELYFDGSQVKVIPPEISKLTNLTKLDLHNNMLETVPSELCNLTNLELLDLASNDLTSVPEIGKLTNLTSLSISYNYLDSLPMGLGKLGRLESLNLEYNKIKTLSAEIGKLPKLTTLNLASNQLSSLPDEILSLTNVTSLNLSKNQLDFATFEKLNTLPNVTIKNYNQDSIPLDTSSNILRLSKKIGGSANIYTWYCDGKEVGNSDTLDISPRNQTARYCCKITNSTCKNIELTSNSYIVWYSGSTGSPIEDSIAVKDLFDSLHISNTETFYDPSIPLSMWKSVVLNSDNRVSSLKLNNKTQESGILSKSIGKLSALSSLDITLYEATYPEEFYSLKLKWLQCSGVMPDFIKLSTMKTLQNLYFVGYISAPTNYAALGELQNLQVLCFYQVLFPTIPVSLGNMINLKNLTCYDSRVEEFPPIFSRMTSLESLIADGSQITFLPDDITLTSPTIISFNRGYLAEENLTHSQIDWLNSKYPEWKSVQHPFAVTNRDSLALNYLKRMNPEATMNWDTTVSYKQWEGVTVDPVLNRITELHLSGKNLQALSSSIRLMDKLTLLDVSNNNLTSIPAIIYKNTLLRSINASNNKITLLFNDISESKPSVLLNVSGNNLKELYLEQPIIDWLDTYSKEWRTSQTALVDNTTKRVPLSAILTGNVLRFNQLLPVGNSVALYNISGRMVVSGEVTGSSFAIPNLAKGIYVAEILAGKHSVVQKVVVR